MPPVFLAALDAYAPLLPELPYEDWLLETRQYLADLYVDGCLCAAQTFSSMDAPETLYAFNGAGAACCALLFLDIR